MSNKFTDKEVALLKKCVKKYENILKITTSKKIKNELWQQIEKEYNSKTDIHLKRNYEILRRKWNNIVNNLKRSQVNNPFRTFNLPSTSNTHSIFGGINYLNERPSTSFAVNSCSSRANALKEEISKIEQDKKEKEKELEEIEKFKEIQKSALLKLEVALIDKNTEYQKVLLDDQREEMLRGFNTNDSEAGVTIEVDPINVMLSDSDNDL